MTNKTGPAHAALNAPLAQLNRPCKASALLLGTALGALFGLGYARGSYAQGVTPPGDLSSSNDATVEITGPGIFETQGGFSVDAKAPLSNGIAITTPSGETGDTVFNDQYGSEIAGSDGGIYADSDGTGGLTITTTGVVTGMTGDGIYANNSRNSTGGITIVAHDVMGEENAIDARNYGAGTLSIEANGDVSNSADESASIYAQAGEGAGDVAIKVSGTVTNTSPPDPDSAGIYARTKDSDISVILEPSGSVSSVYNIGVNSFSETGGISISTVGSSISAGLAGVVGVIAEWGEFGMAPSTSTEDISLSIGDVSVGGFGVYALNMGNGGISITTTGKVQSNPFLSTSEAAIVAVVPYGAGNVNITVDEGSSISTSGSAANGSSDIGIYALALDGGDVTISIADGGSVSNIGADTDDWAIQAAAPNGAVIVKNLGMVTGRVNLTSANTFTNSGTWDLAGTTSDFNATGNSLVVNEGLIITAKDSATTEISAIDNLDTFQSNAGGTISLADGAAGDAFLINGDEDAAAEDLGAFVTNGGKIELDVDLSGDGSEADIVAIAGDIKLGAAPTELAINSVGDGTGGTSETGIRIVHVAGGTSDEGAFVLTRPVEVGAIAYDLSLGDCTDQANEDWYLCNTGATGTTAAVFEAMPEVILNGFAGTAPLKQRLASRITGAPVTVSTRGDDDLPVDQAVGPWMRTWGDFADITPDNSSAGTSWESDSWGLEAGIGAAMGDYAAGDLVGGINLRYSATYADLSNPVGTGSVNSEGFGVAASLTWFGNDGFYVDANGAVDFVSIDASSQGGGELLDDYGDVVYSASAEIGKRIELQGGTALVPQAQLSWGKMRDGQLTDNLGNVISFADRETLTSRFGLTVEQDVTDTAFGSGKVYGFGNVLNDLSGTRSITVAGTNVTQSGTGDWVELGGGFSLQPSEGTNLFGQVSYREAFDGVSGEAIAVSAGWKMQW